MNYLRCGVLIAGCWLATATIAQTDDSGANAPGSKTVPAEPPQEEPRQEYLGRTVAQYMTYHGAGWLIRDSRNREEATDLVMKNLDLKPGMVVCDLGCGNGYYTLRFARQIAPRGRVLAVDIQPEMLQMLAARSARARLEGIEPVRGEIDNPNLPAGEVDLVFMADVYHEFSHPESMLYWIRRSLKPDGVVALLEYREEDPTVPIKPLHKMSKAQIIREYEANGLKLVREFNGLPIQHLMYFARDDSPLPKIDAQPWSASEGSE
jgi:ubiquinone/menaquinone biosynthesis C-methylase UbiE